MLRPFITLLCVVLPFVCLADAQELDSIQTASPGNVSVEEVASIEFTSAPGKIFVTSNRHPVATYEYADKKTTRPFLSQVCAPGGIQVTRNHPPQAGDPTDHADYHPGIFLAFGDISGNDYWRMKAKVEHAGFEQQPTSNGNQGHFIVKNRYLSADGKKTICTERCKLTFTANLAATESNDGQVEFYKLDWESSFTSSDADFYFGDQEEMGLGARVASPIREKGGNGRVLNSDGMLTAKKTWGKPAKWVDYAGSIAGHHVGITIIPDANNARPSWWHNRDYGVFVANMFGRKAMKQGEPSKLVVKRGDTFRLGYHIYLHASRKGEADIDSLITD